jgi:hypothetical protein
MNSEISLRRPFLGSFNPVVEPSNAHASARSRVLPVEFIALEQQRAGEIVEVDGDVGFLDGTIQRLLR